VIICADRDHHHRAQRMNAKRARNLQSASGEWADRAALSHAARSLGRSSLKHLCDYVITVRTTAWTSRATSERASKEREKERERKQERLLPFDCNAEGKFNTDAFSVAFYSPRYLRTIRCMLCTYRKIARPPKRDSFDYRFHEEENSSCGAMIVGRSAHGTFRIFY